MSESRVQQNYWAILVAAIASFALEAGWYTIFLKQWIAGIGRTMEWLMASGVNPLLQYATALLCATVIAAALSRVVQLTGEQTAMRGIKVGALLWLGFIFPALLTEYVFEVRPVLLAINSGFWLLGFVIMGAIVGGWKKKAARGAEAAAKPGTVKVGG